MSRRALPACTLAAVVGIGALAAAAQDPGPGGTSGTEARDPEAMRADRLARDRARYEALVEKVDRFGHLDEFARIGREMLEALPHSDDARRFIVVRNGTLTDVSVRDWLEWNVPAKGREVLPAVDFEINHHPFDAIVDFDRQLRAHGIDFLVVSFPTRVQLYPELFMDLPSMEGFAAFCPGMSRFSLELVKAGVEVAYFADEFIAAREGPGGPDDQLYLKYNQHWTPRGAELGAKLVSERLKEYPWFRPGPAAEGADFIVRERTVNVSLVHGGTPEGAEPEVCRVNQVLRPNGRSADSVRPSSPIVLLTGSFGDFHHQNLCDFTTQLYRMTGWQIDKISPVGGVEDKTRMKLRDEGPDQLSRKKIVIWMLPEQTLRPGRGWKKIRIFDE